MEIREDVVDKATTCVYSPRLEKNIGLALVAAEHAEPGTCFSITTPEGWKDAYRTFCESGWNGLAMSPEYGGQGLPKLIATAVSEMWDSANMAFSLCPLLTAGAIEAIERHGSESLKSTYLEKLVTGAWTGTMNLTEPQAGSDLSAVISVGQYGRWTAVDPEFVFDGNAVHVVTITDAAGYLVGEENRGITPGHAGL